MNNQQSGFTLIELIMVIVVLGALAITVLPKYVDLQTDAQNGAVKGVAGSLAAGSAINYAACKAGNAACVAITNCSNFASTVEGGMPVGYAITAAATAAGANTCTVAGDGVTVPVTVTANFVGLQP